MADSKPTLLVTGASGQLGRMVIELLLESGVSADHIIGTTRTPEKLADLSAKGVVVRHADFNQPETLAQAFAGADRLLLISTDTVAVPGKRIQEHLAAVKAADEAGVKHVVYTSLIAPDPTCPITLAPDHHATETALEQSKMGWTISRNNIYANGLVSTLAQAVQRGGLANACGEGRAAYITREDCARAAAAMLASSFEGRRVLDITGPDALSQADLAGLATELSGVPVTYTALPVDTWTGILTGAGLPPVIAELVVSFDKAIAQNRMGDVSTAFEELTGRKPERVADYLRDHRAELLAKDADAAGH